MAGQRKNYLYWDEYFMSIVAMASLKSVYEPKGACLVDSDNRILSIGSNQAPYTIQNRICGGLQSYILKPTANALFTFKGQRSEFENGVIYLSDFPTPEDARNIAQARLKRVVYLKDISKSEDRVIAERILDYAQVELQSYLGSDYTSYEYNNFLVELQSLIKTYIKKSDGPINSEEYYMGIAVLSALRSKDPKTQVGACLVDDYGRVISVGYNGAPYGMTDEEMPWHSDGEKSRNRLSMKDDYVIHAEQNILDNYRGQQDDLYRMKLYVTFSPCEKCTERLIIASPNEIIWLREYQKKNYNLYSRWFSKTETNYHPYNPNVIWDKESYNRFFEETTKVIKKNLGKPGIII